MRSLSRVGGPYPYRYPYLYSYLYIGPYEYTFPIPLLYIGPYQYRFHILSCSYSCTTAYLILLPVPICFSIPILLSIYSPIQIPLPYPIVLLFLCYYPVAAVVLSLTTSLSACLSCFNVVPLIYLVLPSSCLLLSLLLLPLHARAGPGFFPFVLFATLFLGLLLPSCRLMLASLLYPCLLLYISFVTLAVPLCAVVPPQMFRALSLILSALLASYVSLALLLLLASPLPVLLA